MAAPQLADLVLETSNAPGTGPIVLGGAPDGRQTFADAFPAGGEVYYYASDGQQTEWGVGTLTVGSPNTLARTTVLGNLFGTKTVLNFTQNITVWCEIPAEKCLHKNDDGSFPVRAEPDYTQDEAVSAKSADARYAKITDPLVRSRVGDVDYQASDVGVQKSTGRPWAYYTDKDGKKQVAIAALASDLDAKPNIAGANKFLEVQSFAADTNFSGYLNVSDGKALVTNSPDNSVRVFRYADNSGTATTDINRASDGANLSWLRLYQDGNCRTNLGEMAFVSQLPFSDTALRWQVMPPVNYNAWANIVIPLAYRAGTIPIIIPSLVNGRGDFSISPSVNSISNTQFTMNVGGTYAFLIGGYF